MLKKLFPYTSRDIRYIWDQYEHAVYGVHANEPIWYSCTATVTKLVPVVIEVLRHQNPQFGVAERELEYVEALFAVIRDTLVDKINEVVWIDNELSNFLVERLQRTTVEVGVPFEVLRDENFLDKYYTELFLQTSFIENFEYIWTFEKSLMSKELGEFEESDE